MFYLENNLCQIPQGMAGVGRWHGNWKRNYGASASLVCHILLASQGFLFGLPSWHSWASYLLHYLVTFTSFAQDYERAGAGAGEAQQPLWSRSSFFYSANFSIVVVAADFVTVVALICMTFGCA